MESGPILLSISILTSHKEEIVRRCLDSLAPLRRELSSELILVDTSEDKHLHDVLADYTDHIIPFHWINDFAEARNAGLREARGEWFLYLDDDEYFEDSQALIDFFKSGTYRNYDSGLYIVRNFTNFEGTDWEDIWVSRLARLKPGMHFTSPIHEYLTPIPGKTLTIPSVAYHYGYVYTTEEQKWERFRRNSGLIQSMIEKEPDNVRWRTQMLMEYWRVEKLEEFFELARDSLEYFADSRDPDVRVTLSGFQASKLLAYHNWFRHDLAYKVCREVLSEPGTSKLAQAYFRNRKAEYEMEKGNYAEAEQDELFYLNYYESYQRDQREQLRNAAVPVIMNTYHASLVVMAYSILICAGLKQKNVSYLRKFYARLQIEGELVYFYPMLPEIFVEAMATREEEKLFACVLESLHRNEQVWQRFEVTILEYVMKHGEVCDKLTRLLELAGIDPAFMELYVLRNRVSHPEDELTGERLAAVLEEYVRTSNRYYENLTGKEDRGARYVDADRVVKSESDEIGGDHEAVQGEPGPAQEAASDGPGDYRATRLLRDILAEQNLQKRLAMLKGVVEAYPPLSEAVKRYAVYLGERITPDSSPETVNPELEEMARQVIANVRVMIADGMYTQALGVVGQLRGMLPQNQEIAALEEEIHNRSLEG